MKNRIFYLSVIALAAYACNGAKQKIEIKPLTQLQNSDAKNIVIENVIPMLTDNNETSVEITVPETSEEYPIDKIIESCTFIPLETSDQSLIGDIQKLLTDDNYIFLHDRDNDKLLQFTDDGKFVRQIGSQGRGPGEYTEIWNVDLNKNTKEICLLDLSGRKLLHFDYNGSCTKEEPLYFFFTDMAFYNGKRYYYTGNSYNKKTPSIDLYRLVVADEDQSPRYKGFPIIQKDRNDFNFSPQHPLQKYTDGVFYTDLLSPDTTWRIDAGKRIPAYVLKYAKRGEFFSPEEKANMTDALYQQRMKQSIMNTGDVLITDKLVHFDILDYDLQGDDGKKGGFRQLFYNKKTGNTIYIDLKRPDISSKMGDYIIDRLPDFVFQDTAFVFIEQPGRFMTWNKVFDAKRYDALCQQDKELVDKLDLEDNPVLMIVKYKDF